MRRPLLRPVARILLVALAPLADGCVSIGVSRSALEPPPGSAVPPTGALAVSVFEKVGDRRRGARRRVPGSVRARPRRLGRGGRRALDGAALTLTDLQPGSTASA